MNNGFASIRFQPNSGVTFEVLPENTPPISSPVASKETPLMKQYNRIKVKHPDTVLLFRVGDFYETFGADAVAAAKVLTIVLTSEATAAPRKWNWLIPTPQPRHLCPSSSSPA